MQEDKTVPIDTSGESLEVTLEEENVKKIQELKERIEKLTFFGLAQTK